jgi:hypothetical protein
MAGSIDARVAVNHEQIRLLWEEVGRTRDRCHELETDRATVLILKRMVEDLDADMPTLARQAAREAVNEYLQRQRANTLGNWRTYAAVLSAGAAIGALIVHFVP